MCHHPSSADIFPNTESKPPLAQYPVLSVVTWGKKMDTHLCTPSFEVVVESNKVFPDSPFFQAKQPQVPLLLFIRLVLQINFQNYTVVLYPVLHKYSLGSECFTGQQYIIP